MSKTQKNIDSLAFQTNHLYEAVKRAMSSQVQDDAIYARHICSGLDYTLSMVVGTYIEEDRKTKNSENYGKYIIQKAIMTSLLPGLEMASSNKEFKGKFKPSGANTKLTFTDLKKEIDSKKGTYSKINYMAYEMGMAGKFDDLIEAIEYVRNN